MLSTHRPEEFDDVERLVVLHPDRWLRHLVFVNTPGLTRNDVRVQRLVSSVVDRAGLVFWVFDARDISNAGIAGRMADVLTGSSSRIHGVLNKVDQFARSEARRARIIEATTEVERHYGRFLASVIPYSARPEALDGRDPDVIDFKAQLSSLLDARFRDALGERPESGPHWANCGMRRSCFSPRSGWPKASSRGTPGRRRCSLPRCARVCWTPTWSSRGTSSRSCAPNTWSESGSARSP